MTCAVADNQNLKIEQQARHAIHHQQLVYSEPKATLGLHVIRISIVIWRGFFGSLFI